MPFTNFPILQASDDLFCIASLDGYFIELSPSWEKTLGWSIEELKKQPYINFIHPDDLESTKNEQNSNKNNELSTQYFENRFQHSKGHYVWLAWKNFVDTEKKIVYASAKDISNSKINTLNFIQIEEVSKIGFWEIDLTTKSLYWSKRTHEIHETDYKTYHPKLIDGMNFYPEKSLEILGPAVEQLINFGIPYKLELEFLTLTGKRLWVLTEANAFVENNKVKKVYGTFKDITNEKKQKILNEEILQRFNLIFSSIRMGVWDWDIIDNKLEWDQSMYELFEVNKNDFVGAYQAWENSLHLHDKERTVKELDDAIVHNKPFDTQFRIITNEGRIKYIAAKAFVTRNESGKAIRVSGLNWDITESVVKKNKIDEQQRKLLLESEKFENIVNNIPIMLSFYNERGEFQWCNKAWEKNLGWNAETMQGKDMLKEFYPDESKRKEVVAFMSEKNQEWKEFHTTVKDGSVIYTKWANVKLSNGYSIGIGQDITALKLNEQTIEEQRVKMITSSKLSSLGEMASGIAHEINNPLAIILGQISLLKTKINKNQLDPKELIEKLDKIDNTSNRIVKIIKGLRSFSRNADNDPFVAVKLQNIFENIFELCREKFKNNQISITIEGDQSLSINARQTQIEQVFTNLINNSFDAIVESKDPWVKIFINEDQSSISIKFRDSGLGIPPEIYTKMMQPFFTTKEVGKGTGLGLSISKGIIEDHQGKLFYNQDSLNTEFVIQFPKIK